MPQRCCDQHSEDDRRVPLNSVGVSPHTSDPPRRDVTQIAPRRISTIPFESNRELPKTGAVSPLRFEDIFKKEGETVVDIDDKDAPPVKEIIIPKPQPIDGSTGSINEDTAPVTNCGVAEDYKHMFFCNQREIHALRGHISCVEEENRQLKRNMIEMQKRLYSYSRNKRQSSTTGTLHSAWSIPPSSCAKRNRVEFEATVKSEPRRVRPVPTGSSLSGIDAIDPVRMSVSTEDCVSEPNEMSLKV